MKPTIITICQIKYVRVNAVMQEIKLYERFRLKTLDYGEVMSEAADVLAEFLGSPHWKDIDGVDYVMLRGPRVDASKTESWRAKGKHGPEGSTWRWVCTRAANFVDLLDGRDWQEEDWFTKYLRSVQPQMVK